MAKVFMSFLGTNRYVPAHYQFKGQTSKLTPFVQEALVELLCKEWGENDRLVFFLTPEACKKNWEDGGNFNEGLKTRLEKANLNPKIESVTIFEGRSEEEIRKNFQKVVKELSVGDEVWFDITHSFRSLPMLNLVALTYARVLKCIKICGIYYGAFEVLGAPRQVENIPENKRLAPIFDLTYYVSLLDWSFAVDEFTRYGLVERLNELVQEEVNPILKETKGQNKQAKNIKEKMNILRSFTLAIYTSRCPEIESFNPPVFNDSYLDSEFLIAGLLNEIENKLRPFKEESSWEKALSAVRWCIDHKLVQQSYTILLEAVISELCRILGAKNPYEDKHLRDFVASLLNVTAKKTHPEEWKDTLKEYRERGLKIQKQGGEAFFKLAKVYQRLTNIRNDINHCGCRKDFLKSKEFLEKLEEHYQEIKEAMSSLVI